MYRPAAAGAMAALMILSAGCHDCTRDFEVMELMNVAEINYKAKNFANAAQLYITVLDKCADHYDAIIGLANAWREYGNDYFKSAEDTFRNNPKRIEEVKKAIQDGNKFHSDSERFLRTALNHRPDDLLPHYGLGLLYYQRATSPYAFPYALSDRKNRHRERDIAIEKFKLVTSKVSQLYEAHLYLGLALFAAGRMEEGIVHLSKFHSSRELAYGSILRESSQTDEERKKKDERLRYIEREIEDVRQVLMLRHEDLVKDQDKVLAKEEPKRTVEDKQELGRISREMLAIENIVRKFQLVGLDTEQESLRQKCRDFLEAFNRGLQAEILAYLWAPEGKLAALERLVLAKLEEGTKFRRVRFRSIVVSGNSGTTAFECEVVTRSGAKPESEVVLRWRRVEGQWVLLDCP